MSDIKLPEPAFPGSGGMAVRTESGWSTVVPPTYTAEQAEVYAEARAKQAAELERERCAQLCEQLMDLKEEAAANKRASDAARNGDDESTQLSRLQHWSAVSLFNTAIRKCVDAIRGAQ